MLKTAYLITVGTTPEAVINCFWAYINSKEPPDVVHFVVSKVSENLRDLLSEALNAISEREMKYNYTIVDEENILRSIEVVKKAIEEYKRTGHKVVVDVTPGRKTMSIALFQAALEVGAEEAYYLHLRDRSYERELYPLIPTPLLKLVRLWSKK